MLVRAGLRQVLLRLWEDWESRCPSPEELPDTLGSIPNLWGKGRLQGWGPGRDRQSLKPLRWLPWVPRHNADSCLLPGAQSMLPKTGYLWDNNHLDHTAPSLDSKCLEDIDHILYPLWGPMPISWLHRLLLSGTPSGIWEMTQKCVQVELNLVLEKASEAGDELAQGARGAEQHLGRKQHTRKEFFLRFLVSFWAVHPNFLRFSSIKTCLSPRTAKIGVLCIYESGPKSKCNEKLMARDALLSIQ